MVTDPYASHLPFLSQLGAGVKSVLELGAGMYSTPLFLDRTVFPGLTLLMSVEHVRDWLERMPQDPRLVTVIVEDPAKHLFPLLDLNTFDLIFVDNAPCEAREAVIRYLSDYTYNSGVRVVIHDFEYDAYRQAAGFDHMEVDKTLTPWTALVWND